MMNCLTRLYLRLLVGTRRSGNGGQEKAMNHSSLNLLRGVLAFGLVSNFSFNFSLQAAGDCREARGPQPVAIAYFDVPDLPARVDEPKLRQSDQGFVLDCAVANRSSEQLATAQSRTNPWSLWRNLGSSTRAGRSGTSKYAIATGCGPRASRQSPAA